MKRFVALALLLPFALVIACGTGNQAPIAPAMMPIDATASAPSTAPSATAPSPAAVEESNDPDVRKMLKKLAVIRGLRAKKPVPGVELDRQALLTRIRDKVLHEVPAEEVRRESDWIKLFGFFPTDKDYLDETMRLLEAQLAGFYEPNDGTMYIASDMDEMNSTATLAHELVHALQDQYYDLKSRSEFHAGESDKQTALSCLAEGDATSVMTDVILKRVKMTALDQPDDDYDDEMRAGMNTGAAKTVPKIMRTSLVVPYIEGIKFVHALRRAGGFPMVDSAWRDIPTTTEQILHPDKWRAHEAAIAIAPPTGAVLGAGYVRDNEDTSGELGLRVAYEEWVSRGDAAEVAENWGGDRGSLFIRANDVAAIEHVRYDAITPGSTTGSHASAAFKTLADGFTDKVSRANMKRADFICIERPSLGPLALSLFGDDLVLSAGPATRSPNGWKSAGSCTLADAWAHEVLGNTQRRR